MRARTLALALLLCAGPLVGRAADPADSPCHECHDKGPLTSGKVHSPVAEGDCEACHVDHGDQEKLILVEPVPALCFQCHDQFSKAHRHPPAADGECLECHRVHSSPARRLLTKAAPALCTGCHDGFAGKSVHSPVADGECGECHRPHDAAQESLLTARYDRERYAEFSEEAYALCFNCHDSGAFSSPEAGRATAFRQGNQNLHYVHVYDREIDEDKTIRRKKKRRMSCAGCHQPHASGQERLVREGFQKDKVTVYQIQFTRSETGGGCVVGCHKPQDYGPGAGPPPAGAGSTPEAAPGKTGSVRPDRAEPRTTTAPPLLQDPGTPADPVATKAVVRRYWECACCGHLSVTSRPCDAAAHPCPQCEATACPHQGRYEARTAEEFRTLAGL